MFSIITTLYILIAVKYLEEKDLRKSIGIEYENYQNEVPMIVPFTKTRKKGLDIKANVLIKPK